MASKKKSSTRGKSQKKLQTIKRKEKRNFFLSTEEGLQKALTEIEAGHLSIRKASQQFNVPKTTIIHRMKGRSTGNKQKTGPEPLLGTQVENRIIEWVINIAKCGFPLKKSDLLNTVEKLAKDLGKDHLFKDGKPGQKWYFNFLKCHPEISLRC